MCCLLLSFKELYQKENFQKNYIYFKVDGLLIRPIISHIGTSFYHLAKYLAQLLENLSESQYVIKLLKTLPRN